MTTPDVTGRRGLAELSVSGLLLAVGGMVILDAARLPDAIGQAGAVGPKAVPFVVGGILVVTAVLLAIDVLRGGAGEIEGGEDVDLQHPADWSTVALLAGAFIANVLLMERLGWPLSGAVLFFGTAFALGSRGLVRNLAVSLFMSFGSYFLFAKGLGVGLPAGVLGGVI